MNFRAKNSWKNRMLSVLLAFCMVFSGLTILPATTTTIEAEAAADYGLADSIQEGVILHCFNWKYNDIKAELPNIAAAGFTSVQTSPAQVGVKSGVWYWLYQPLGFYVGTNDLGTKAELQALCAEAEKYGINVIVDVVANHLAGDHSNIQDDLKDGQYWHNYGSVSSWADRYQVTHGEIGMPDLNSEHSYVQQVVSNYINELKGLGVDGIRWDAAKHIALPSEGCNFWPAVTGQGLFHYGEILVGPDDRGTGNEGLMVEYTNYMTVTDSTYGKTLLDCFASGTVPTSFGNWAARGVSNSKLVYWGESHDTWSNNQDWGYSNGMSQNVIDRAYAVAASRNDISALYFSRPSSTYKESIYGGQKGSTHYTSAEVAEVNKFHNAKNGEADYYTTGNNCAVVSRVTGAVVVAGSGSNFDVTVPNGGGITQAGTYIDAITGAKWTVTSTNMSGKIGSTGIAVLYKEGTYGTGTGSGSGSGSSGGSGTSTNCNIFYKDTNNWGTVYAYYWSDTNITMTTWPGVQMTSLGDSVYGAEISSDAKYIIFNNGGSSQTDDLTIAGLNQIYNNGSWSSYGSGSGSGGSGSGSGSSGSGPSISTDSNIFYKNSNNWSTVYAYYWSDANTTMTTWPGVQMTNVGDNVYGAKISTDAKYIIFSDGNGNQTADLTLSGMYMLYNNGSWSSYGEPSTVVTPSQVTGVKAVYQNGKIKITWNDNGASKYKVVRSDGRSGYQNLTYSATASGWTDSASLVEAQLYYYRVIGYFEDAQGNLVMGDQSSAVAVVATDSTPNQVVNVKSTLSGKNVTLTWDAADSARYYKVSRAAGVTGKYYSMKYNIESTSYTDTSLAANTYRYKVVGYYKDIDGSWVYGDLSSTLYVTVK